MFPPDQDPLFQAFQRDWEGGPDCDELPDEPIPVAPGLIIGVLLGLLAVCFVMGTKTAGYW